MIQCQSKDCLWQLFYLSSFCWSRHRRWKFLPAKKCECLYGRNKTHDMMCNPHHLPWMEHLDIRFGSEKTLGQWLLKQRVLDHIQNISNDLRIAKPQHEIHLSAQHEDQIDSVLGKCGISEYLHGCRFDPNPFHATKKIQKKNMRGNHEWQS